MENINKGEILNLKDVISYEKDTIVKLPLIVKDSLRVMIMAFDEGKELTPHSAPGDALLFALEGNAYVYVDGKEMKIHEGEQVVFPKDITHNVKSITKFKMFLVMSK